MKAWEAFHIVQNASPFLSKRFVDSNFEFNGKALSGVQVIRPRWKRGVSLVDGNLGEAVGREYVRRYFPASSKAKMDVLVANLKRYPVFVFLHCLQYYIFLLMFCKVLKLISYKSSF